MTEESKAQNTYQIVLQSIRGEEVMDVTMCSCVRAPFYKKASFWILKANMASWLAQQLMNEISTKTTKQFELTIWESIKDEKDNIKHLQKVHQRQLKCIHAVNSSSGYKINTEDANSELILTLVDYVIFDLFTKRSFNRKFKQESNDVEIIYRNTAFNAIDIKYREFLLDKYGDDTFNFNHINIPHGDGVTIINDDRSNYEYEEILLAANNDLDVTDILLYNKKAMKTASFYFFDDFYLSEDVEQPITCHFINLNDSREFTKFDITEWHDTYHATSLVKEIPINDDFYKLIQGQDSTIIRHSNMTADRSEDSAKTFYPENIDVIKSNYDITDDKRKSGVSSIIDENLRLGNEGSNTFKKRQKSIIMYSQDSDNLTKERLKNYRIFVEARSKQFVISQTQDCFCDWMQFGRSYNLDVTPANKEKYLHTPIAIENVFYKDADDQTVKHVARTLLLEYYSNIGEDGEYEVCSGCEYYSEGSCNVHHIAKLPESWCYDHKPLSS
jgi:hypothetical protein